MARIPWAVVALVLSAPGLADKYPPPVVAEGEYFYNFENSKFTPKGSSECWAVQGNMKAAELPAKGPSGPWGTAQVKIEGFLSGPGKYGNLGTCTHLIQVIKILRVEKREQR